jgi:YggT family protein
MGAVAWLIDNIISLYILLLLVQVVMSWLIVFNVVNVRHPLVNSIGRFLYQITEPALRPIRRIVPTLGGIDISPLILVFILGFARKLLLDNLPY